MLQWMSSERFYPRPQPNPREPSSNEGPNEYAQNNEEPKAMPEPLKHQAYLILQGYCDYD